VRKVIAYTRVFVEASEKPSIATHHGNVVNINLDNTDFDEVFSFDVKYLKLEDLCTKKNE
jgi:hypothetical protein